MGCTLEMRQPGWAHFAARPLESLGAHRTVLPGFIFHAKVWTATCFGVKLPARTEARARQTTIGPFKSHPPNISFDHGKHCGSNNHCNVRTGACEQHRRAERLDRSRCERAEHRGRGLD